MSRSYFHRRHRKPEKTPPYWIRVNHTKPHRRAIKIACAAAVQGADPDSIDFIRRDLTVLDYWL